MKNFTLLFSALLLTAFSWQANAQYSFPVAGPVNVPNGAAPTVNFNDLANTAGVPITDTYSTFSVSVDWVAGAGGPYSSEGDLTMVTNSGSVLIDPATTGSAFSSTSVTMTFDGTFTAPYDPSSDGLLDIVLNQSWSGSDADWSNIVVTIFPTPACPDPSAGTATNITSSSADLSWTAGGTETMWDLEYGVAPYAPTGTPSVSGVTNPYNYSGLAPGTTYEFYVRADCGGTNGTSAWVGPYSFTTYGDCASSGSYDYVSNSTMASSLQSFVANTPGDYITLTFSAGTTESCCDDWFIMDAADGTGNVIASGAGSIVGSYESTTGEISFYVESDGSVNGNTFVYGLACSPPPSCPDPSAGTATNITSSSADLSWTAGGTETMWDLEYGVAPYAPTGTPSVSGVTNPYNYSGLAPGTTYEFYVRADCGGTNGTSAWVGPYSFTTYGDCASSGSYDYVSNSTMASSLQSFVANTPGDYITLTFSAGTTESCCDDWFIMDAADGTGNVIASGAGSIVGSYESTTGEISFYVESDGSVNGNTFVYGLACSPPPSCPDPSAGTATNITSSSADLSWTAGGTETMWDLEYGVAPYAPTGTPSVSGVTNPYNYSGLAPGTTYEFYVRADCGGTNGTSAWVGPYSFTTYGDCASSGSYDYVSNSTMASSLQSFVANTPGDYITLTFSAGTTESCCDDWFIMDAADGTGNVIASGAGSIVGSYESTTGEISFYVESDGSVNGTTFVYGLACSPPPSCPDPSAGTATNITSSSADLGWTENGTATSWEVEWGAAAFTPGSGTAVITGTNPHAVTGLTANSSYDFYVRAICGVGDTSAWAGPTSFTTLCPAAYSPAYLENFTSFVPGCWDEASDGTPLTGPTGAGSGEWGHTDYLNNGVANDAAKINLYNTGTSDWLLSPNFDMSVGGPWELVINAGVTTYNATGSIAMGSDDSVQVVISTDGGLTWGAIYTWDVNNTPSNTGEPYAIDLAAYTGAANLFGIWASEGVVDDSEDYDFHINDFEIRVPPLCAEPSALTATNITPASADLGWVENGSAISWQVEWGTTAFTAGTGTAVATATNPYALTGLTANSTYDFYVRAICGVGDTSVWTGPYSFTTPCSVYTPQYLETFNTWVSPCWDQADAGSPATTATSFGSSNWNSTGFLNDGSGAGAVKINLYFTGTEDWMVSPTFDLSAGGPWELKIEAGVTGWNSTAAQPMGSDDMVQVVASTDGGATWSVLHTWDATNQPSVNGEFLQLDLSAYTGASNIFAIWAYDGTVNDPEDFDFHIGSFEIKEASADDLAVLEVTTSASTGCSLSNSETVTIQFKNTGISSQSNFEVGYSVNGTPITPETIAGPIAAGDTITYTFTALVDMSIPMVYDIEAYTALASDVDLSNDSMSISVNHIAPSLTFNDSLLITDGLSNGTHGIVCTNGLLPNELTNCYKLSAVVIDSLVHTWDSDLTIYLITPNGDSILLSAENGGSGDDYIGVVFTDTAATSITAGTAGFGAGGYYSIEDVNGLGSYIGFDPNGTWDLWITDGAAGDNGMLFAWHLEFQDYSFVADLGADTTIVFRTRFSNIGCRCWTIRLRMVYSRDITDNCG